MFTIPEAWEVWEQSGLAWETMPHGCCCGPCLMHSDILRCAALVDMRGQSPTELVWIRYLLQNNYTVPGILPESGNQPAIFLVSPHPHCNKVGLQRRFSSHSRSPPTGLHTPTRRDEGNSVHRRVDSSRPGGLDFLPSSETRTGTSIDIIFEETQCASHYYRSPTPKTC